MASQYGAQGKVLIRKINTCVSWRRIAWLKIKGKKGAKGILLLEPHECYCDVKWCHIPVTVSVIAQVSNFGDLWKKLMLCLIVKALFL